MQTGIDWSPAACPECGREFDPTDPTSTLDPLRKSAVRVFANHELLNFRGYTYSVNNDSGGSFTMEGARITYFDIDKDTRHIVDTCLIDSFLIHPLPWRCLYSHSLMGENITLQITKYMLYWRNCYTICHKYIPIEMLFKEYRLFFLQEISR